MTRLGPALGAPPLRRAAALLNALLAGALLFLAVRVAISARFSFVAVVLIGALVGMALLATFGAVGLWRGSVLGAFLTLVVQGTQLIQAETRTLTYTSSLPVAWVVGLGTDGGLHAHARWRPGLEITPDDDPNQSWIGLDLLALGAIVIGAASLGRRPPADPSPVG